VVVSGVMKERLAPLEATNKNLKTSTASTKVILEKLNRILWDLSSFEKGRVAQATARRPLINSLLTRKLKNSISLK